MEAIQEFVLPSQWFLDLESLGASALTVKNFLLLKFKFFFFKGESISVCLRLKASVYGSLF